MANNFMIRMSLLVFLIGICNLAISQIKGDYVWQLGVRSNSSENPYALSIVMEFNNNSVTLDTFFRSLNMGYFNASISDENGVLLLYSNGCQIRDGNHRFVEGSQHLNPGSIDVEYCIINKSEYPLFESGLFLPFFEDSVMVLLHQRVFVEGPPLNIHVDSLFYSSVLREDSTYNILEKTVPIVGDYLTDGNVEAVKAKEPGAWWVLQGERESNRYFSILFDSARVDTIITQSIGDTTYRGSAAGQAVFSPDGTMYARYNPYDDLFLFDFDRETGLLSNYRKIHVADSGIIGGLAFSPSGRFLYACGQSDMYQFDTWESDIEFSKVHLGHYDGFFDPFPSTFYHMQLGPDCRIYIGCPNGIKVWHVIHEPDLKGLDCRFEQHGFRFPVSNSITMPNFPNYRLDIAPPCDPDIVSGLWEFKVDLYHTPLNVFPNPTTGDVTIALSDQWINNGNIQIMVVDQLGQTCFQDRIPAGENNYSFSLDLFSPGMYFLSVKSESQWYGTKISKM